MTPTIYHKTTNNNMTSLCESDNDYGYFYDIEKDVYLDNYKHLKRLFIEKHKHQSNDISITNKKPHFCDIVSLTTYILISTLTVSATIYYFK